MTADVLEKLAASDPAVFASRWLFEEVPHVFAGDRDLYVGWKHELGSRLGVDPCSIFVVGTGALGVSMNPRKDFKEFDGTSDIDVAVVSAFHFDVGWNLLRNWGSGRLTLPNAAKHSYYDHVGRLIYWGTLGLDALIQYMPFGRDWIAALTHMAGVEPTVDRDIKLRVYRDMDSLRAYQVMGIGRSKRRLSEAATEDAS